jgi:predicted glycoside hydrolase/deacetylase ChbG (UPF0249 family)
LIRTKQLIVNADDFGFTRDVNEGILEAHRNGIVTSTTLMANGVAFDHAVSLARENPSLDIGCHLTLIGGDSLSVPGKTLPASIPELLVSLTLRRLDVYEEFSRQIGRIFEAGICPSHLDTHKHTHVLPTVLCVLARLSQQWGIPWLRRPLRAPGLNMLHGAILRRHHCRTTDHFLGRRMTGRFGIPELVSLIHTLPDGVTEFMCHPGRCTSELLAAPTRLKQSRQRELEALISPEIKRAILEADILLVSFRALTAT